MVFAAMVVAPLLPSAAGIAPDPSACGAVAEGHADAIRIILDKVTSPTCAI